MMEIDYQDRLRAFVEGKHMGRLAKYVRNSDNTGCDACGSPLPSTLYGLRDNASGRNYFVGQNCLTKLLEMGLIARGRYRQTAEVAYRREMEIRQNAAALAAAEGNVHSSAPRILPARGSNGKATHRTVLIVKTEDAYRTLIHLDDGKRKLVAVSEEPRWRQTWSRRDGLVLLERAAAPRRMAFALSVFRAYARALCEWQNGHQRNGRAKVRGTKAC